MIAFLLGLHKEGKAYSTINSARSALSSLFSINGPKVGEHPLVCRFMAGIRKLKAPVPKYPVFWDASVLLNHLASWKVSPSCLKDVTLKLATIIACLSLQRVHTITNIDCNPKFEASATFLFVYKDLKVARNRPYFVVSLPPPGDADPLATTSLLKTYLDLTEKIRPAGKRQLFISYSRPHNPVSTDTVARWIRSVMSDAKIDSSVFGAHSVRGASASAAQVQQAPLESVLRAGDWSGLRSYSKHYQRKETSLPDCDVANALLKHVES